MKKQYNQHPLHFKGRRRAYVLEIIRSLHAIPRTGWKDRQVENPETVGEHTEELLALAARFYPFTPDLDKMLKVHDWPESEKALGDIRTDSFCPEDHRWSKEKKYAAELLVMERICRNLGPSGKEIMRLWLEFEEGKTARAQIAKQLDKLQAILKAIQYQRNGQPVKAQEFIDYSGPEIKNPELIKALEKNLLRIKTKALV
jgi:putative hydrolase of HD superfamily